MRCSSIDDFRGLSIFFMFVANFILLFCKETPVLLSHALPNKMLPFDLVAPLFGFTMGLCLPFSHACARKGYCRIIRRTVFLFIIGYLPFLLFRISTGEPFWPAAATTWGILETWALTYTVTYFLFYLPAHYRIPLALALALFYQLFFLEFSWVSEVVLTRREGGPLAILSWSVVNVTGSLIGESLRRGFDKPGRWVLVGIMMLIGGVVLHITAGAMDRFSVSISYTVFASGFSLLAFLLFYFIRPQWGILFRKAGKYPLLAWIAQGLFYGPVYYFIGESYFDWQIGFFLALLASVLLLAFTSIAVKAGLSLKI